MSLLAIISTLPQQDFSIEREGPINTSPSIFKEALGKTNQKLNHADATLESLARGDEGNLHQTMIALEEAKMSLHLLVQVRNRLLSAYHDVLREQI